MHMRTVPLLGYQTGFSMFELVLTLLVSSSAVCSTVSLLYQLQLTSQALPVAAEMTSRAENARVILQSSTGNGMRDVAEFSVFTTNQDARLSATTRSIDPGSASGKTQYSLSWTTADIFSDGISLDTVRQTNAPPFALLKSGNVTVAWKDHDGTPKTISTPFNRRHPLTNALVDKISRLNTIRP